MSQQSDGTAVATARESTRGVAIITLAKVYFLATGFLQPVLLTRVLHEEGYGLYNSVLNTISIVNNVVVAGSIQSMSKAVAEMGDAALRRGLALHAIFGTLLAAIIAVLAGPLGASMRDAQFAPLLRLAAIIVANYSVYAALVGALNGRRRFVAQARLDMTFSTMRTALVLGLAASIGVSGAVGGFASASAAILLIALFMVVFGQRRASVTAGPGVDAPGPFASFVRRYVSFFAPVLLYQLALNMVMQADLLGLKWILAQRGVPTRTVNTLVGVYGAVQKFAFLPYQILVAVTFVLFPVVTAATHAGDRERVLPLIRGSLRFSALALGAMLAVLAGLPGGVLRLAYPAPYVAGAAALRWLALGQGAFALTVITTTIVLASGRTAAATIIMVAMLAAVALGDGVGIMLAPVGHSSIAAAAIGTASGCMLGLLIAGVYARRELGAFVPAPTAARALAAMGCATIAVAALPLRGKVITLSLAFVAVAVYALVLVLLGEVGPADRAALARVLERKGAPRL